MASSDPALRIGPRLREDELADAEALVRESSWNQTAADWKLFLDFGTVYAVRADTGRVIATAATLPYGGRFAWISMVLVAGAHRRQGLATQLLHRCVEDIAGRGLVPILDATPAGRAVYRGIGFEDGWSYHRLDADGARRIQAPVELPAGVAVEGIADDVWPAICAYDAAAFGADRSHVLARLRARLPGAALYGHRGGRIVGFLLGRDGLAASHLGPLVAEDPAVARSLLAAALGNVAGRIFVDFADRSAELRAWLENCGFEAQRPFTRMLYRTKAGFDDPARTFAVVGPEFG